jgi:hypothetical protein
MVGVLFLEELVGVMVAEGVGWTEITMFVGVIGGF